MNARLNFIQWSCALFLTFFLSGCVTLEKTTFKHEKLVDSGFKTHLLSTEKPSPTIVLAHGCDSEHLLSWYLEKAKIINSWGYNVVLVDSYSMRGDENLCKFPRALEVSAHLRAADFQLVGKWVKTQPWHRGKIGAIGYSTGGAVTLALSQENARNNLFSNIRQNQFSALVAYYPGCALLMNTPPVDADTPIMVHIGNKDDWTPIAQCMGEDARSSKKEMVGKHYYVHIYENATHSFDTPGVTTSKASGHFQEYNPQATSLANQRTKEFFEKFLN